MKFIFASETCESLLGKRIWEKMSKYFKNELKRIRTWQSLRERFIKRILPKIYQYENVGSLDQVLSLIEEYVRNKNDMKVVKKKVIEKFNSTK